MEGARGDDYSNESNEKGDVNAVLQWLKWRLAVSSNKCKAVSSNGQNIETFFFSF